MIRVDGKRVLKFKFNKKFLKEKDNKRKKYIIDGKNIIFTGEHFHNVDLIFETCYNVQFINCTFSGNVCIGNNDFSNVMFKDCHSDNEKVQIKIKGDLIKLDNCNFWAKCISTEGNLIYLVGCSMLSETKLIGDSVAIFESKVNSYFGEICALSLELLNSDVLTRVVLCDELVCDNSVLHGDKVFFVNNRKFNGKYSKEEYIDSEKYAEILKLVCVLKKVYVSEEKYNKDQIDKIVDDARERVFKIRDEQKLKIAENKRIVDSIHREESMMIDENWHNVNDIKSKAIVSRELIKSRKIGRR